MKKKERKEKKNAGQKFTAANVMFMLIVVMPCKS